MKKFIQISTGFAAVIALAAMLIAWNSSYWWPFSSALGKHNALVDISQGHYKVLTYGLADPSRSTYANLLRERYGVELHAVAGCIVSKSLIDYVAAYNEVSTAAIKSKFGRDVFKETADEDERNWKQANPIKSPK